MPSFILDSKFDLDEMFELASVFWCLYENKPNNSFEDELSRLISIQGYNHPSLEYAFLVNGYGYINLYFSFNYKTQIVDGFVIDLRLHEEFSFVRGYGYQNKLTFRDRMIKKIAFVAFPNGKGNYYYRTILHT